MHWDCFHFILLSYTFVGYVFSIMVILAAGVALMGYCIGCTIRYRYMMWKYKRKNMLYKQSLEKALFFMLTCIRYQ